jgi:hypothetical protein
MYEGRMSGALSLARGTMQAGGLLAQGSYDSAMIKYNAAVNSRQITIGGRIKAADYRAAGDRALVDGMFNAASKGAQTYAAAYRPTSTTGAGTSPIV